MLSFSMCVPLAEMGIDDECMYTRFYSDNEMVGRVLIQSD